MCSTSVANKLSQKLRKHSTNRSYEIHSRQRQDTISSSPSTPAPYHLHVVVTYQFMGRVAPRMKLSTVSRMIFSGEGGRGIPFGSLFFLSLIFSQKVSPESVHVNAGTEDRSAERTRESTGRVTKFSYQLSRCPSTLPSQTVRRSRCPDLFSPSMVTRLGFHRNI